MTCRCGYRFCYQCGAKVGTCKCPQFGRAESEESGDDRESRPLLDNRSEGNNIGLDDRLNNEEFANFFREIMGAERDFRQSDVDLLRFRGSQTQ